jgi:hypothetical protein
MAKFYLSDPIIDQWMFMRSPGPIVGILVVYLFFVLKAGPKWMENRKPFELKKIMIGYNAYQVCFSIWLCSQVSKFCFRMLEFRILDQKILNISLMCRVAASELLLEPRVGPKYYLTDRRVSS